MRSLEYPSDNRTLEGRRDSATYDDQDMTTGGRLLEETLGTDGNRRTFDDLDNGAETIELDETLGTTPLERQNKTRKRHRRNKEQANSVTIQPALNKAKIRFG